LKPVSVGSIIDFTSTVTLIEEIEGVGDVMRIVCKGFNEFGEQAGQFNFLFVVKNKNFEKYILPETFDQILEYHEATRRL
jgi:hypothetical protein